MAEHLLADWSVRTADVPARGLDISREAAPAQRAAIAVELDLIALNSLAVQFKIRPEAGGYTMKGSLKAECEQACIVTLDPVQSTVSETINAKFVEGAAADPDDGGETEALTAAEIELVVNGMIDAGRIIFETLAAGLDPYPRKQGAEFDWRDQDADAPSGPFAGLAKLKPKAQD